MTALVLLVVLALMCGCSSSPAPATACTGSAFDQAVAFDVALLRQAGEDLAICSRAGEIATCLTPEDSCDVCVPLRCCPELEAFFLRSEPVAEEALTGCRETACPVCAR